MYEQILELQTPYKIIHHENIPHQKHSSAKREMNKIPSNNTKYINQSILYY